MKPPKILFVLLKSVDSEHSEFLEELRKVEASLQQARHRANLRLKTVVISNPDELEVALLEHKPLIVHFAGHASPCQGLHCSESPTGSRVSKRLCQHHTLSGAALGQLIALVSPATRLVVLNACRTETIGSALQQHVDFVIATRSGLADAAAQRFSMSFYRSLGFGESIETSFEMGKQALEGDDQYLGAGTFCLLERQGADRNLPILASSSNAVVLDSAENESPLPFHRQTVLEYATVKGDVHIGSIVQESRGTTFFPQAILRHTKFLGTLKIGNIVQWG